MVHPRIAAALFAALAALAAHAFAAPTPQETSMHADNAQRIQPYAANPAYWQYRGKPVLLLGGSVEDNLFQIPDLEAHLDLLASVGGNYVRCTMSSRDPGNVWPFERDPATGLYDLRRPGAEYWARFERFLALTEARSIIVQIEVWDRFDFARDPWQDNPYNPKNNSAYSAAESGLAETIASHPGRRENAFFRSVPALENNQLLLPFQHAHVDRLLEVSLPCGHVLYCIDNETNESPEWGAYWARYIRQAAERAGRGVETTEMWDAHDLASEQHAHTYSHPDLYTFVDISQNNHSPAPRHWDNMQWMRTRIADSGHPRPINTVKIYGANTGRYGSSRDGQERFWRNILGGLAATRFHRPPSGLGLSDVAQAHIQSMRILTERINVFACRPALDLLAERSWNEAYALADPGNEYAVFFTDGGNVTLDVSGAAGRPLEVTWLDIRDARWLPAERPAADDRRLRLVTPRDEGYWAVLVKPQ